MVKSVRYMSMSLHGVPIFVLTRGTPPQPQSGWVHYVPDAATAMREAKA